MGAKYYFRGFVAITLVQQLGILMQIYIDSDSLQRAFLAQAQTKRAIRPYVALFFANAIQQLILKSILQCSFDNLALHIVHALSSMVNLVFFAFEIFLYGYFQQSVASLTQMVFSGLIVFLTVTLWSKITPDVWETTEREPRPRRLTARHYMESHIKDFETDPKKLK